MAGIEGGATLPQPKENLPQHWAVAVEVQRVWQWEQACPKQAARRAATHTHTPYLTKQPTTAKVLQPVR